MDDYPIQVRFPMHWGEMDALGHANNTRYFRWFETARIALFERLGLRANEPMEVGPILATTTCDFLRPVVYPANLVVGARVARVGNTSFLTEYAVARTEAPGELYARGSGVIVVIDYRTMAKVPVPDEIRAAIDAL